MDQRRKASRNSSGLPAKVRLPSSSDQGGELHLPRIWQLCRMDPGIPRAFVWRGICGQPAVLTQKAEAQMQLPSHFLWPLCACACHFSSSRAHSAHPYTRSAPWSLSTWPWTSGIPPESGSILFNYRSKSLAKLKTQSFVGSRMVFWPVYFIFNVLLISSEMSL